MSPSAGKLARRLLDGVKSFGIARWTIVALLLGIWVLAAVKTDLNMGTLIGDCLVRTGMNGILVLALVLPIRAGNGINFGTPIGIVFGLLAGVLVLELAAPHPFGIESLASQRDLAEGWSGFILACIIAIPMAALAGWGYGWVLERVRGQGMIVGIFLGFASVSLFSVIWLMLPLTSPELVWAIGGKGLRNTILLNDYFRWILDAVGEIWFGEFTAEELGRDGEPPSFSRPDGLFIPTGLLLVWLGACAVMAAFLRTRLGTAMTAAGTNPEYARSIGIHVPRLRILSVVISTVLAAIGILVYSQSYGFFQLYSAPLWMGFVFAASILLGGASFKKATIFHVIVGTFLFQSILVSNQPLVNKLTQSEAFKDLPEISRMIIQNGIILYALAQVGRSAR